MPKSSHRACIKNSGLLLTCKTAALALLGMLWLFVGCTPSPPAYPPGMGTYRIAIDPGHGGENNGVQSVFNDLEKHTTLEVARLLNKRLLAGKQFVPVMVRDTDVDLKPSERWKIVSDAKVDALVSFHFNGGVTPYPHGFSMILSKTSRYRDNIRLAAHLSNAMIDYGFSPDRSMGPIPENAKPIGPADIQHTRRYMALAQKRGIYEDRTQYIGLLRRSSVPAVIVEGGYFSNYIDCARFHFKGRKMQLVYAIEAGLIRYFHENELIKSRQAGLK